MSRPSSPRGWLSWAVSVKDSYHRAHGARYDDGGRRDRRMNYSRETAISIIRMVEKSANGNGGAGLLYSFYVEDAAWCGFTGNEQRVIAKTARAFARALRAEGFLP
jgi:hypothetical protein